MLVVDVRFEDEFHAERFTAMLEDVQQALAADAAETVTAGRDGASLEMDIDVVPAIEGARDFGSGIRIGRSKVAKCLVGKDDAPSERVVGTIALDDANMVASVRPLHQQRQIEAGGSA